MQQKMKMCRAVIVLCLGFLLLVISPTAGVSIRGEKVEDEDLPRTALSRSKGGRDVAWPWGCSGLYSWCWYDYECCTTWCNGWCVCLGYYQYCYYDYECCTGWCDWYYGCIYPYAQRKKVDNEISGAVGNEISDRRSSQRELASAAES